jgi:hypothetical protein
METKKYHGFSQWPKLSALNRLDEIAGECFETLPFCDFAVAEWESDPSSVLRQIAKCNLGEKLAVRSCAASEDSSASSFAPGYFASFLGVDNRSKSLRKAIAAVVSSYGKAGTPQDAQNRVIVQTFLENASTSGVMKISDSPGSYVLVDYSHSFGRTDTVTSGRDAERVAIAPRQFAVPQPWSKLRECADIISLEFGGNNYVEFALSNDKQVFVFQVRPVRGENSGDHSSFECHTSSLRAALQNVQGGPVLSSMADWNPVEILGTRAKELDVSLYDRLIMDGAWLDGRASLGWNIPGNQKLMRTVSGKPYVDVETSFASLLPAGLSDHLIADLVNDRLDLLAKNPDRHDKIEFEVLWSAYPLDAGKLVTELRKRGFCESDINELLGGLKRVTRFVLENASRFYSEDLALSGRLQEARARFPRSVDGLSPRDIAYSINHATRVCREFGTIPFSRQARIAFVYKFLVEELKQAELISIGDHNRWYSKLNSISRRFRESIALAQSGQISSAEFLEEFGHLRPATYNLESLRYDESEEMRFATKRKEEEETNAGIANIQELDELLRTLEVTLDQKRFWADATAAINAREEIKFRFSALLSDMLRLLAMVATRVGITKHQIRSLTLESIIEALSSSRDWEDAVLHFVKHSSRACEAPKGNILLPEIIFTANDLLAVKKQRHRPTFVGKSNVKAPIIFVNEYSRRDPTLLKGCVVLLETADPGYEWIFASEIAGVITAYGGAFSHIGVRCAELGVPAAIGCGDDVFRELVHGDHVELDVVENELRVNGLGDSMDDA